MSNNNMRIYSAFERTPDTAKKAIMAGRLKGKTDINPMHRIKQLTERFGPCGIGWYTDIIRRELQEGPGGSLMCFIDLNLYYREDGQGEWSNPVFGTGGNSLIAKESNGLYANDEGWKMAYTDALSIACKALGMCADVYYDKDYGKYTQPGFSGETQHQGAPKTPALSAQEAPKSKRMAAPEQIKYIKENATPYMYQKAEAAFGADLGRMTFAQAEKMIARINGGAKNG